jgi:hypothetical protein
MMKFFLWECPKVTLSGGLFTKLLMLAIGLFCLAMRIIPGLRIAPAFSRKPGVPAAKVHRIILFFIGALVTFQATKLLLLCP